MPVLMCDRDFMLVYQFPYKEEIQPLSLFTTRLTAVQGYILDVFETCNLPEEMGKWECILLHIAQCCDSEPF